MCGPWGAAPLTFITIFSPIGSRSFSPTLSFTSLRLLRIQDPQIPARFFLSMFWPSGKWAGTGWTSTFFRFFPLGSASLPQPRGVLHFLGLPCGPSEGSRPPTAFILTRDTNIVSPCLAWVTDAISQEHRAEGQAFQEVRQLESARGVTGVPLQPPAPGLCARQESQLTLILTEQS